MSMHKISDHFSRDFLPCIRNVVQKKAILLQHQHLELLLQVIAEVIAPSHRSSPTKSKLEDASPIFNDIVAILTTLIRQRRDLLQAFIPQLSQLLGTLTSLLRVPHAQLGGAQQRLVAEAFPSWLNPFEQSLGEADARALARLLTSITARTQTLALRSRKRSREGDAIDRTDFLSKPFARHAMHVMVAYVRALIASPYMFIPNNVQRALEPGLFALCDITSGHDRDAALVGLLDPAGRTLMKRIWSNWEAQRYKGQ
jgi:Urb2/Npa2 family